MIKLIDEEELRKKLWAFYNSYISKEEFLENEIAFNLITVTIETIIAMNDEKAIPAKWIEDYALSQWNTTTSEYHAITDMVKAWIYDDDYTGYARIYEDELLSGSSEDET